MSRTPSADRVLLAALVACAVCALHGISATITHPDQMALRPLFLADRAPFNPGWFEKPPGYSYVNWLLAVVPVSALGRLAGATSAAIADAEIYWSRIVATGMLLAAVALAYDVAGRAWGTRAARVVAVVLALGAGLLAFVHQLTSDVPVMLAMLVAFRFALSILERDRGADYVAAGLATGVAAAVKYNGLGVGVALVIAHASRVLATSPRPVWRALVVHRGLWLGLAMVPVGFVLLNPYALFDFRTFWADFRYNTLVAPVYEGQTGSSWGAFFARIGDLVGIPATVATLAAAAAALVLVARAPRHAIGTRGDTAPSHGTARCETAPSRETAGSATFWTTLAVVAVYYATFGRFPRLETRFVLPIVPFVLLLAGPAWERLGTARPRVLAALGVVLAAYGLVSSAFVGRRFLDDPRYAAATWLAAHVPPGSRVEVDEYSPGDDVADAVGFTAVAMPFVTGRERLFQQVFPGDRFVLGSAERQREVERPIAWYTAAGLAERAPDFVIVNSLYYDRFLSVGPRRELYPSLVEYFESLLGEAAGYRIVFDRRSPAAPPWIFPRAIDFLDNRATVLQRRAGAGRDRR